MIGLNDIHALSDFQRHTRDFLLDLEKSGRPAILTVNGKAKLVVQDAASYQKLLDIVREAQDLAAAQRGMADYKDGKHIPFDQFAAKIRKQYGITKSTPKSARDKKSPKKSSIKTRK
jgi:PHD/YefM family antitoxin component YafN of YafNO toxin-antitoxin module